MTFTTHSSIRRYIVLILASILSLQASEKKKIKFYTNNTKAIATTLGATRIDGVSYAVDTDGDGIDDDVDIDDDNDGILDLYEGCPGEGGGTRVVFILDTSGSISPSEYTQMTASINNVATQLFAEEPLSEIAVVQYGGFNLVNHDAIISRNFSSAPLNWQPGDRANLGIYDHLPASMYDMRPYWVAGGPLDLTAYNSVSFVIFTDAAKDNRTSTDTSVLFNTTDSQAALGYGEYDFLKTTYNARFLVVHAEPGAPGGYLAAKEISSVDENGMNLAITTGFTLSQNSVDSIVEGAIYERVLIPPADIDEDNIINCVDLDSDNDGISDLVEGGIDVSVFDPDQNGVIDGIQFTDLNKNGLADGLEAIYGENKSVFPSNNDSDTFYDFLDLDSDEDGIPDTIEAFPTYGYITNDGDVSDDDKDGDGIINLFDTNDETTGDFGGDFKTPQNTDEILGVNPDSIPDYLDLDSDGDGLTDEEEGGSTVTAISYKDPNGNVNTPLTDLPDFKIGNKEVAYRETCAPKIDSLPDATVCERFILPALTVGHFYTESGGGGSELYTGDLITTNSTIFIYAKSGTSTGCESENSFKIVINSITPGVIEQGQTLCSGTAPQEVTVFNAAISDGNITYQWQNSTDNITFTDISGATNETLTPSIVTQDNWFKRIDTSTLNDIVCTAETNTIKVSVISFATTGVIEKDQTICFNSIPEEITEKTSTEAFGNLSYQWQSSEDGDVFTAINEAINTTFTPAALTKNTWYKRIDTATLNGVTCVEETNAIKITVLKPVKVAEPSVIILACDDSNNPNATQITIDTSLITGGTTTYTNFIFLWDNNTPDDENDDVLLQEGERPVYTEGSFNKRRIIIKVNDDLGCFGATEIILEERIPLSVAVTVDQELCVQDENGRITLVVSGGAPPYSSSLNSDVASNYVEDKFIYDGLTGGKTYVVYVKDGNDCVAILQVPLEAAVNLEATFEIDYFCETGDPLVKNKVSITLDSNLLEDVIFTIDGDISTSKMEPYFTNLSPGSHQISIAYKNGCISNELKFEIDDISPLKQELLYPQINTVQIRGIDGSGDYQYRFGDGSFGRDAVFAIQESGTYIFETRDSNGCEVQQSIFIEYLPITIPNFFTPNNDGSNDGWTPVNIEQYPNATTQIRDRYGRNVTTLQSGEKWDGFYEENELPTGDYWYILELNTLENKKSYVGHFSLYR